MTSQSFAAYYSTINHEVGISVHILAWLKDRHNALVKEQIPGQ